MPENGRYLGNLLGVLQGKLYFVPVVGPILRGLLMGGRCGPWCACWPGGPGGGRWAGESLWLWPWPWCFWPQGGSGRRLSPGGGGAGELPAAHGDPPGAAGALGPAAAALRPAGGGRWPSCGCLFMETTTILLAAGGGLCALLFRHTDRAAGGPGAVAGELAGRPGHVHRLRLSERHQRRPADGRVPGPGAPAADCDRGGGVPRGGCPAHQRSAGVAGTEGGRQVEGSRPGPGPPPPAPAVAGGGELAGGTPV